MGMDAAMLWVALCSALAAVASAVFAFVQARAATDSRNDAQTARKESQAARDESARLAGEANAAFVRQAEAQEEANRLKQSERYDWTFAPIANNAWRAVNTSGRVLIDVQFHVAPDEAKSIVDVGSLHMDGRYEPGDTLVFLVKETPGIWVEKFQVSYRFVDEPDAEKRIFWFTP